MIKKKLQQELSRVSRENKNLLKERDTSSDIDNHRWATIIKLGTQIDKLQAENKELKEQQLTVDTIEKVFDKHTIIANSDILYRKDLAIDIIKAREDKIKEIKNG